MMERIKKHDAEPMTRKAKFGILDVVIILLIITCVLGVYFRYNILDLLNNDKNMKEYAISYSIEDIRYSTPDSVHINDAVYFADDETQLGTVMEASQGSALALSVRPAEKTFLSDKGTMEKVSYPNETRVDAKGRLLCKGSYSDDGGFLVNGSRYISAGQSIYVYTELVTVSITITDIQPVE